MPSRRWLFAVLLLAATARLWGLGFGIPFVNARPDETQVAGPAVGFLSGDLRPPLLEWPTLFPYTVAACYVLYFALTRPVAPYDTLAAFAESRRVDISPFIYITRGLSVAMGVLTVWGVYAMAKRAFDSTIAIVAALFLALCFLHVRDSHFGVTDVPMTALVVLAVVAILRWRQTGGLQRAALAGVAAGLAASTKYNGLGVVVPFAVAVLQRWFDDRARPGSIAEGARAVAVFGVGLAVALFTTSPYILIDWTRFVRSISLTQGMMAEGHGIVLGRGWWYYARVVLPAALGWPIFIVGTAGMLALLVRRFRESALVFAFPVAYYIVAGSGYGVFARYIIPVLPFVCVSAAWVTVEAARAATRGRPASTRRLAIAAAALLMVGPTAYKTALLDRLLATTDNRTIVGRALAGILPADSLFYQSGEAYGHAPLGVDRTRSAVRLARFNQETGQFTPEDPDWVLVQRSPLVLYSGVPPSLERALQERYMLARRFQTGIGDGVDRVYDQQDAFYLPLDGLQGLSRPGPEFELYSRRRN